MNLKTTKSTFSTLDPFLHSPSKVDRRLRILQTTKPNPAPPIPITPNTTPKTASTGSLGAILDGREAAGPVAVGVLGIEAEAVAEAGGVSDGAAALRPEATVANGAGAALGTGRWSPFP